MFITIIVANFIMILLSSKRPCTLEEKHTYCQTGVKTYQSICDLKRNLYERRDLFIRLKGPCKYVPEDITSSDVRNVNDRGRRFFREQSLLRENDISREDNSVQKDEEKDALGDLQHDVNTESSKEGPGEGTVLEWNSVEDESKEENDKDEARLTEIRTPSKSQYKRHKKTRNKLRSNKVGNENNADDDKINKIKISLKADSALSSIYNAIEKVSGMVKTYLVAATEAPSITDTTEAPSTTNAPDLSHLPKAGILKTIRHQKYVFNGSVWINMENNKIYSIDEFKKLKKREQAKVWFG